MSIFLGINQQALNLVLSNPRLSHYLVSRCNGQVKTCASYLVGGFLLLLFALPDEPAAFPCTTRSRAGKRGSGWAPRTCCS